MRLNHFICPNCGHDFYDSYAYATCDACRCFFYASQSKTCTPATPQLFPQRTFETYTIEKNREAEHEPKRFKDNG